MKSKIVQKFGNSGHIVLPKEYVGKRIRFIAEPKTFEDIKNDALAILKPYFESILGVYLYGSYARNEQSVDSDVDILVIANAKLKISDKIQDYSVVSVTMDEAGKILENNAVLLLPIIQEAKTIINPDLLKIYKECRFTVKNTKTFMESTTRILELNKKGLELDFDIGSLVYSLILRIRSLLMIKLMLSGVQYSKPMLFSFLRNNGFPNDKIEELYRIYSSERSNDKVKESDKLKKEDISKLLNTAKILLHDVKRMLK